MRGKSLDFASEFADPEESKTQPLRQSIEGSRQGYLDSSTRARSYSDSLPAIFKRNHQYGEFVDDTSDGSEVLSTDTYYTEDRSDTGNGAERHKRVTDKLPAFSTREHKSPLENGCSSDVKAGHSPKKSIGFGSKSHPAGKGGAINKTPPLPTKKTKMQTTDSECSFEALQDSEGNAGSPVDREVTTASAGKVGNSPFSSRSPATPRTSDGGGGPIARSSPSLMSQAARLAASFGQAPYKAMARRKTDDFSPMDEARPDGGWCDEGSGDQEGFLQQRQASPSASRPLHDVSKTTWHPEAVSPEKPLLGKPSPSQTSAGPLPRHPAQRAASLTLQGTVPHQAQRIRKSFSARDAQSGKLAGAVSHRGLITEPSMPSEAFDIFEPRPPPSSTPERPASLPSQKDFSVDNRDASAVSQSLDSVKSMKGHEALEILQQGSLLRKKWLESYNTFDAQQSQKTERLIRCRVEKNRVVLHYYHQGVKGLLAKEEMSTSVQRVEIPDSNWKEGDCIILHTARGLLALAAPNAALHSIWVLGLNAALASCNTRGKDNLLTAPVRAIPRNAMFVVTPAM